MSNLLRKNLKNDKKRAIFFIATEFQFMTATKIKLEFLRDYDCDILFYHDRTHVPDFFANVASTNCFKNVFYYPADLRIHNSRIMRFFHRIGQSRKLTCSMPLKNFNYDNILFYNVYSETVVITNKILKTNPDVEIDRFEEGYSSYLNIAHIDRVIRKNVFSPLRKLFKFEFAREPETLFLYHPELLSDRRKERVITIPDFSRHFDELRWILNKSYAYYSSFDPYKGKTFIIFEESFTVDNQPVDDEQLFVRIAKFLGLDNVIIKLHPRSEKNRFSKYGIETSSINIPWELYLLNTDCSDKIFISVSSGSVLSPLLYFSQNIPTLLLFPMFPDVRGIKNEFLAYINRLLDMHPNNQVTMIQTEADLFKKLSSFVENVNSLLGVNKH